MGVLTVIADASFCQHTKAAGWGAWLKGDRADGVFMGAAFSAPIQNSERAELCAIVNAVHRAHKAGLYREGDTLSIQSDCMWPLGLIAAGIVWARRGREVRARGDVPVHFVSVRSATKRVDRIALDHLRELTKGCRIVVRHVRGHTGNATGRSYVNARCDEIAKGHMRQARLALKEQAVP
jgi:ribonuclease HI